MPAYHPDTPEVRRDWAQYHDNITTMDGQVQARLDELEEDGLADDTIIFFYGDHGSGMPRSKRFAVQLRTACPLIVTFPGEIPPPGAEGLRPGGKSDRLVGFVDLAPTMLSLAGVKPPDFTRDRHSPAPTRRAPRDVLLRLPRAHGRALRPDALRARQALRLHPQLHPHKIYGQHLPTCGDADDARLGGALPGGQAKPPQTYFWETKPAEELYDLQTDRDEVNNLAGSPEHAATLERFRKAHREHELQVTRRRPAARGGDPRPRRKSSPYEMGHDAKRFPVARILAAADLASSLKPGVTAELSAKR